MKSLLAAVFMLVAQIGAAAEDLTQYIDPRIGNVSMLMVPTFPTFSLPNQLVRMIPDKTEYVEDQVAGFPLQLISHRMGSVFSLKIVNGPLDRAAWTQKMTTDHDLEIMHPWHYSTYLIDDAVRVSFTPASKAGVFKIEFSNTGERHLLIGGSKRMTSAAVGVGAFDATETVQYVKKDVRDQAITVYAHGALCDEQGQPLSGVTFQAVPEGIVLTLPTGTASTVLLKYGISYISTTQAQSNYTAEVASASWADLIAAGHAAWQQATNQIIVEGGTIAQKRIFYTALYRTRERMVNINEGGQYYSGYDQAVHASDRPFYVDDWTWDTYLAAHPLATILNPQMESDILNSYTLMYEQSGWLPTFPVVFGNWMCMNSYHSAALFIDAQRKGIRGFDREKSYAGIKKNLSEGSLAPWRQGRPKGRLDDFFYAHGFYPALPPGASETEAIVDTYERRQSVAVTLGIAFDAWCLAEFAKDLGKMDDYATFSQVAQDYHNLWHPEQRLFMPKSEQGTWIAINPKADGGRGFRDYYDENNGWTYAWQVQHDIPGLVTLLGGEQATEDRLDQLFREPLGMRKDAYYVNGSNATGLIGQFAIGNEPAFHIPFLYNYVGAPWKTQKRIRLILDTWFKDNVTGMPGDEDGGGMSGFVILASIGLYQVTPGIPILTITSPVFTTSTINLDNGKTFVINAPGASKERKYITQALLNGQPLDTPFIPYATIMAGGSLDLTLTELPNKAWGKNASRLPGFPFAP